jgi:hypothetical protein
MAYQKTNPNGSATSANSSPVVVASDQGTIPVSGTVTANLGATDNAVLDQIELNQDSQTAILTTIDTDTGAMVTALQILDNAISGNEMQVDVLTLPAVTGTVTANLSATDNAVLDTIDAVLDTINAKLVTGTDIGDVTINNAAGAAAVNIQDGGNTITVDGTVTANLSATDNAVLDQIELNQDTQTAVLNTIDADTGSILTAVQLLDDTVFADDAAVTLGTSKGNVMAGVAVQTDGTDPTAVSAEGDASSLRTDMNRILLVNQTHPRGFTVSADYAAAQTNVSVKVAPGASLSIYITDIQLSNGATAGNVTLLDGSGGTVLYEVYPAINGGAVLSLRTPIKLTANTALCLTSTTVTTHSIFIGGYIAP